MADNLGGSGGLTLSGGGTLVLTGMNTFTGGSTINAGTLQLGAGGTSGSVAGNVTDNGTLAFNRSDDVTFHGIISGSGSLVQAGTGTLTLTGMNTFAGGTTINAGTLQVGDGGTSGSVVGNIIDNGVLVFDRSDAATFSGAISGNGSVRQSGAGTLTLTNVNTYTGETTIALGGTLAVTGFGGLSSFGSVINDGLFDVSGSGPGEVTIGTLSGTGNVELGTRTLTLSNASGNFSGVISGSDGAFSLDGGTETLSGANTYGNETDIESGTLALTGGGGIANSSVVNVNDFGKLDISRTTSGATITALSGSGQVVLGGRTLTVSNSNYNFVHVEFSGTISGTGGFTLAGGTLALTGANTYTGPTSIDTGATLVLGNGISNSGGSIAGSVVDNGVLEFDRPQGMTYGGIISGAGSLTLDAQNAVTLTGANTFTGGVTIGPAATLLVSGDANLGATNGSVDLDAGVLETTESFTLTHNLVLSPSGGGVQTDADTTLTVASLVSGTGGLGKNGSGTLVLDNSSRYLGGTYINSGTLQATAMLPGDATVAVGGTLDAVPGVAGSLSDAGRVAVHGGDTSVGGNYSNAATGTLAVSLGSKLAVTGTATLNGGTLEVTGKDSGYVANTHTDVLTATGGVTGNFDQLVKDNGVVFTSTTIGYGANDVYLDATGLNVTVAAQGPGVRYTPASMGGAVRVQGAFEALDAKIVRNDLGSVPRSFVQNAGAFQQATNLRAAQDSLESLSGQLYAASAGMTLQAIDATTRHLSDRLEQLVAYGDMQHAWVRQFGMSGDMARGGYGNVDYQLDGTLTGADMRLGPDAMVGMAVGEGQGFEQLSARFDHNLSHDVEGMAYAGWIHGRWYAHGRIGLGHYHQYMQRFLLLGPGYQPVATDFAGAYNVAYAESGLHFGLGGIQLTPFADLEYDRVQRNGFAEYGAGGFGLKADEQTITRSLGGVGFKLGRAWRLGAGRSLSVDARAQWRHTLSSSGTVFNASFVGVDEWQPLTGVGLSQRSAVFGLDLSAKPSATTTFALGYEYLTGDRGRAMAATANFSVVF